MSQPFDSKDNTLNELAQYVSADDAHSFFSRLSQYEQDNHPDMEFYEELQNKIEQAMEHKKSPLINVLALEKQRLDWMIERHKAKTDDHFDANMKGLHWMDVCRSLRHSDRNLYFLMSGRDREQDLADELQDKKTKKLRKFYYSGAGRLYMPDIINFYLRVYNLPKAWFFARRFIYTRYGSIAFKSTFKRISHAPEKVISAASTYFMHHVITIPDRISRIPIKAKAAVFVFLKSIIKNILASIKYIVILLMIGIIAVVLEIPLFDSSAWSQLWHSIARTWPSSISALNEISGIITVIASIYYFFVFSLLCAMIRRLQILIRLSLPRLLGGIIVGYLVLVFAGDVWRMIGKIDSLAAIGAIFCLSVVISFLFLVNEVRGTVRKTKRAIPRASLVLLIGILEAFVVGLVLSDLFGSSLAGKTLPGLTGLFGTVYPRFVIITAPLSLLIGIFVQLIWDEKPITEPF